MSESENKRRFVTKKVAPEGGWGWLILIGTAMPAGYSLGSFASFGLLYNDFITEHGGGTSAVTIITGFHMIAFSFAGLFASILFKKFPLRNVGLFGSFIFFTGSFLAVFANSIEHLIIFFGIFQGLGVGFMIACAYTTFNHYFVERRVFVMSLAQTLKGFMFMAYPIVVQWLVEAYSFRGAVLFVSAIHAHAFFGMLVMQPVEWHLKEIQVPIDETESLMDEKKDRSEISISMSPDGDHILESIDEEVTNNTSVPNLNGHDKLNETELQVMKCERSKSLDPTQNHLLGFDPVRKRFDSIMSLGDTVGDAILGESETRTKNGKLKKIADFLDLTLFKDMTYLNIVIGISFTLCADSSFFVLLPMYLFKLGFTKADAALIISIGGMADLASRSLLALSTFCIKIQARHLLLIGVIATIIFRSVFLNITSFTGMIAIIIVLNAFRTMLHVTVPIAFADHLPHDRFASGYGLYMFIQGNLAFLVSPIIGWIRDVTDSYAMCFLSLSVLLSLCAIPWITEMVYFKFFATKQSRTSISKEQI